MKKILTSFSGIFCIFLAVVFFLLTFSASGTTSSRYATTATQYAEVSTVTPYILNGEVKISFAKNKSSYYSDTGTSSYTYDTNTLYVPSVFDGEYYTRIENYTDLSDFYNTTISSNNASSFITLYGQTKEKSQRGNIYTTANTDNKYPDPLVLETELEDSNKNKTENSFTTLSIAPFKTNISMTIYIGFNKSGDTFYYNDALISKDSDGMTEIINSVTEGSTYVADDTYTFTGGNSLSGFYKFTTAVKAETAINFITSSTNVMMYLIVLEPDPISLVDNGNTISTNYTLTGKQDLTVAYDMGTISTVSATSGNDSVFTASASSGIITLTPVALGTTTLTVEVTDTSGKTFTKTYNVTVANSVVLKNGGTVETYSYVDKSSTISLASSLNLELNSGETATYSATSSDTNVATVSSIDSSSGAVTISSVNSGVATISVTATVTDSNSVESYTCTTEYTLYVKGYYIAADTNMVVVGDTLTLALYNIKDSSVEKVSGVEWESSDKDVATVDKDKGEVTGVSAGTAKITAKVSGAEVATFTVAVPLQKTYTMADYANVYSGLTISNGTKIYFGDSTLSTDSNDKEILYYVCNKSDSIESDGLSTSGSTDSNRYFVLDLSEYKDYTISISINLSFNSNSKTCNLGKTVNAEDDNLLKSLTIASKNTFEELIYDSGEKTVREIADTLYISFGSAATVKSITIILTPVVS